MAAAVELSACLGHWLSLRWIVAVIADLVILLVTYLVTREGGLPEVYAPLSRTVVLEAQAALLVIYLSSTMVRTLLERSAFTGFEITQWVVALLVSIGGALRVVHGDPGAMNAVALTSLVLGAIFYVVSFAFLERTRSRDRNFYTYSTFGLLLAFTGSRILFSGPALALTLSVLALICLQAGKRAGRTTLEWHGALYLLSAAALSRLIPWSAVRLLGTGGGWVAPQPAAWISAGAALFGYLFVYQSVQSKSLRWTDRVLVLAVAGNCAWTVAGIAAAVLTALCGKPAGSAQNAAFCPTLRTGVLTALSVAIAWGGRRWQRFELVWLVYPFMVLAAYRLIVRDLRQSETIALFASLLLYGGALVLLPRILQKPEGAN
jgi:hypothetical protein